MCDKFQARGYPEDILQRQCDEVKAQERTTLLKKREKKTDEHVTFVTQYNKGEFLYHPRKGTTIRITWWFSCNSTYAVYVIQCPCGLAYVGQTTRTVRESIREHKTAIRTGKKEQTVSGHFFEKGHNVNQLRFQVIDVIQPKRREYDLKPIFR
ncbi:hypothetical protein XELAEV_18009077mg [Xenopus laevis]|uniref:GIY-YIG domain-containing protein n=1 Tax=Xenopus laevis TaxID=8355 RepID=A0A974DTQ1_XENLA|nr:hypothetical protein XELAEV_18009077mg [Xenopus laevis]